MSKLSYEQIKRFERISEVIQKKELYQKAKEIITLDDKLETRFNLAWLDSVFYTKFGVWYNADILGNSFTIVNPEFDYLINEGA